MTTLAISIVLVIKFYPLLRYFIVKNLNSLIGSHIQVSRGFYTHHGIVVDDHKVIHYSGFAEAFNKGCIEVTDLDTFLGDASAFEVVNYPSWEVRYSDSEVVARAYSRLSEDDYNLIFNNCEGFACWCITGKNKSEQVDSIMRNTTTSIISYSLSRSLATSTINETAKRMVAATAIKTIAPVVTSTAESALLNTAVGASTGAIVGGAVSTGMGATGLVIATAFSAPVVVPLAIVGAVGGVLWSLFDD